MEVRWAPATLNSDTHDSIVPAGGTAEPGEHGGGGHIAAVVKVIGGFTAACITSTGKPTVIFNEVYTRV